MKQLKANRTTGKGQGVPGGSSTLAAAGRESIAAASQVRSATMGGIGGQTSPEAFVEGSAVDILLFGFKKNDSAFATSFNASQSSDGISSNAHVVKALQHILKIQPIVNYSISTLGTDGRRLYSEENVAAAGGLGKMSQDAQLQTKIQLLLDQRKPPNEEVPSLINLYDDDLNPIEMKQ